MNRPMYIVLVSLLTGVAACDTAENSVVEAWRSPSPETSEGAPSRSWLYSPGVRFVGDVTVWYPAVPVRKMPVWLDTHGVLDAPVVEGGGWPVVLYGFGADHVPEDVALLAERLVSMGFVVAAPTSRSEEVADRVGDLTWALDVVVELDADPADPLAGRLDVAEVAAIGHDLGASAVEWLVLHDERVDAAISVATCLEEDGTEHLAEIDAPVLYLGGRLDEVCPFGEHGGAKAAATPEAEALVLDDAGHDELVDGSNPDVGELAALSMVTFLARRLEDRTGLTDRP